MAFEEVSGTKLVQHSEAGIGGEVYFTDYDHWAATQDPDKRLLSPTQMAHTGHLTLVPPVEASNTAPGQL